MVSFHVRLLGKFQVCNSENSPIAIPLKAQELLVYLFVHANQPHKREKLSAQLWPNVPENRSKKYLRQALWQLQTLVQEAMPPDCTIIQLEGSWVQFNLINHIWIDSEQFYRTFMQYRDRPASEMRENEITAVSEAIKLYSGEFVTGWYHDWCLLERERFQSMFLAMLDKLIDYCLINYQLEQGQEYAMQMLHYDRARERSHRRLMRLYYLADNRTAALRQFELCKTALEQELNVKPSQKTVLLCEHIKADKGRSLEQLFLPSTRPLSKNLEAADPSYLTLLQSIHTNLLTLQEDMQNLTHAIKLIKDVPADS